MRGKLLPIRSVLIFGGAGFIGSNWAHRLLKTTDAKVHIFDNLSRRGVDHNLKWLQKTVGDSNRLQVTVGDIRDVAAVQRAVQTATEIYHFAAQVAVTTSVSDPRIDFDVNVGGTFNILEAARNSGRRPFLLFTSTNKVYGNMAARPIAPGARRYVSNQNDATCEKQPLDFHSPYGCSKGSADQYVHDYSRIFQLPTVVFRMSCISGPRQFGNEDQGWVAHFLYSAVEGRPVTIYGEGRQVRDVLAVEDLMRAFELSRASLARTAGEIYNVGGGWANSVSLLELIDEIEQVTGHRLQYYFERVRVGDQPIYITDFSKLHHHAGWEPKMGLRQIVETMYSWWKQNRDLFQPAAVTRRLSLPALVHARGALS